MSAETDPGGHSDRVDKTMTGKNVVSAVEQILRDLGMANERNVAFDWMTNRAPVGDDTPPRIRYRLMAVHSRLGGDWSRLEQKRRVCLRFDFQVENKTLVELDRRHHFSSARRCTLDFYESLEHGLDVNQYRSLCDGFSDQADRYQPDREAADFPFPGGRTAQRAYFDTAKDLIAAANGFRLIRLPVADDDLIESTGLRLRVLL